MKKLFKIATVLMAVVALGTSCNNKKSEPVYVSLATIVDDGGIAGTLHVVLDDGKTAYMTNWMDVRAAIKEFPFDNEVRAMMWYSIDESAQQTGYDQVITVQQLYGISTDYVRRIDDHDIGNISDYTAGVDINSGYYAMNYINLSLSFMYGGQNKEHKVYLVYNDSPDHSGIFKDMYQDDGYLYLELYHDNDDDTEFYQYNGWTSWKIRSNLGLDLNDYKGIKILYRKYKGGSSDVCTLKFGDDDNVKIE